MSSPARKEATSEPAVTGECLGPAELYDLIEKRLSRKKLRDTEEHLATCPECVETLAMVLRAERPASREEQEGLSRIPEPSDEDVLAALAPHIGEPAPKSEWRRIAVAVVITALLATAAMFLRNELWLPGESRRAANEALRTMVELRQATGRLPLRYITEFERAGIVRSGFDTTDETERAIVDSLRTIVERAPEPEAMVILGLLLLDTDELDEAEAILTRVRAESPDSVDAINGLAVVCYERARRDPENAYALQQRGLALLREAESADPDDLRVLYNYGKFYDALGMRGAAVNAWERYLEQDPMSQWAEQAALEIGP